MNRFRLSATVLTACLATPFLSAQTAQPSQTSQPAGTAVKSVYPIDPANGNTKPTQANSGDTVPVAAPQDAAKDAKAEKQEEKKEKAEQKKEAKKKKAAVVGDQLPAGMIVGKLIYTVPAEKPAMASSAHISGTVVMTATVEPDGSVKHIKAISGPPMLQQAAIDAASQYKFSPYMLNGKPTAAPTHITIKFK